MTLRFAARAKLIKNHAVINEDLEGDVRALQNEIRNLKEVIHDLKVSRNDN
jgi:kinesin family protein 15